MLAAIPWVLFALVCVSYALVVHAAFGGWASSGLFGDSFGALNTAFSGLAFIAIVINHRLQREDLGEQRKETKLAGERHEQLMEAQQFALQLAAFQTMLGSYHRRLESAQSKKLKLEVDQIERDIADIEERVRSIADSSPSRGILKVINR